VPTARWALTVVRVLLHFRSVNNRPPAASHFTGSRANDPVDGYSGTTEGALRQLDEGHDAWVSELRSPGAAGLTRPQGAIAPTQYADAAMAKRIMHIHREAIHHGAETRLGSD